MKPKVGNKYKVTSARALVDNGLYDLYSLSSAGVDVIGTLVYVNTTTTIKYSYQLIFTKNVTGFFAKSEIEALHGEAVEEKYIRMREEIKDAR